MLASSMAQRRSLPREWYRAIALLAGSTLVACALLLTAVWLVEKSPSHITTTPTSNPIITTPYTPAHYVAPNGSPSGDGSITNPWDLQTALDQPSSVQPGDTIWLRGGTYYGSFTSSLSGSTSAPIIVRQYPGERATLNANGSSSPTLTVNGSDTWYWGFEVMNSNPNSDGDHGVNIFGPNTKFINMVVHDHYGNGFAFWREATNSEIYGSLSYYNGRPTYRAYGIYTQNLEGTGLKTIRDNLLMNGSAYGFHAYGASSATGVSGYVIDGNTLSNAGVIGPNGLNGHDSNLIIGGGAPTSYITLTNNYGYNPAPEHTNFYMWQGGDTPHDLVMQGNYIAGGAPALRVEGWVANVGIHFNTFYSSWYIPMLTPPGSGGMPGYSWDNNTYYHGTSDPPFWFNNQSLDFPGWRNSTTFDRNSVFNNSHPSDIQVFVRPNHYEAGRANITVYNWAHANTVLADVSGILQTGQSYEVRNAQDFYAPPVLSGIYNGGSLTLPMNGLTMAQPSGMSRPNPTGPEFNVFVLVPTSSNATPTPFPTPFRTPTHTATRIPSVTNVPSVTSTPTTTGIPVPSGTPVACTAPFSDVRPTDYFYNAVSYLFCNGDISGYSDNTFRPMNMSTRGQLCKITVLATGMPVNTAGGPHFTDVPISNPFYIYIETAYNAGVVGGYGNTFRPGNLVTRGQICKIAVLALGWTPNTAGGPHFTDVPISNPFYIYIETAYNMVVISGYADNTFHPASNATRGQISKIVYNSVTAH